ncbi:MAG: pyruvate kinase [Deltaproteobacteria bacterium]|nr:pyruvate kinase [Deltaproteobacteria bacterium]
MDHQRRAKIVCTIGPASCTSQQLDQLMDAGMDVARLNFSHGTHEDHRLAIEAIRAVSERRRKAIAILGDLCGPKIRLGKLGTPSRVIPVGAVVELFSGTQTDDERLPVRYATLETDVKPGDHIHIDDARVRLRVENVQDKSVFCVVEEAGQIRDNVGVHLPSGELQISALTEKDKQDLMFCLSNGVDYIAVSFVRSPDDVRFVRDICEAWGAVLPIVSKIETPQAIERLEEIVRVSDAVMVARGDLGVEFPPEHVPVLQRKVIAEAARFRRPVIVATEMLQSMVKSSRPTRAEASDVAHAIFDGADATMLSQESASGDHPALAVSMMARIVHTAENSPYYARRSIAPAQSPVAFGDAMAKVAVQAAHDVGAKVIAVFTQSGDSARLVSMERPSMPIVAFSPSEGIRRRLGLNWGITARVMLAVRDTDEMVEQVQRRLLSEGFVQPGDRIVVVFGAPVSVKGRTNSIRVHTVGP